MPNYRRSDIPGATYFFTVTTYYRRPLLTHPEIRQALRQSIQQVRKNHPFIIAAWVLLPDHLHCIWTLPPGDANFTARWGMIKRYVSKQCKDLIATTNDIGDSRRHRHELGLWQRRFWEHQIRDETDFETHADYIHWNPVKHGYVKQVVDGPYSTFHRYVRHGIYPPDWGGVGDDGESRKFGE
jgi:putative transposase